MNKFTKIAAAVAFSFAFAFVASATVTVPPNLMQGSTGANVMAVQAIVGVSADGQFGPMTKAAVMAYQSAHALTADGVVGPATAAIMNATGVTYAAGCSAGTAYSVTTGLPCTTTTSTVAGCTAGAMFSSTTGAPCSGGTTTSSGLTGGAGSVQDYSLVSGLSNEEVGEDSEDVQIAGLEIEADDSSDIEITAVQLTFNEGTADDDFEEYADEVSIWLGDEEFARVDGSDFTDDNDWTRTISLDSGAIVRSGDTEDLYVAVSGASNLNGNTGETWTVDFTQVRFRDAQATTISEDPTVATTTFSFESFASAADTAFKITAGDEDINDAHVINVDSNDNVDADILSFDIEIEGDADVNLDDLPVNFDVTGAANVDDMVDSMTLYMDGDEVGNVSIGSDCIEDANCSGVGADETYLFENMDLDLNGGDTYNFVVSVELKSTSDVDLDVGDTIAANFGETQTDLTNFNAEDESGEDLADSDVTGTVTGSASEVRDVGFNVTLADTNAFISHTGDVAGGGAGDDDQATFTIEFDVTAFDGDIYIDGTSPDLTGGATESDLDLATTGTVALTSATITSSTGATLTGTINADARFLVEEGTTETFVVTAVGTVSADGFASVSLESILYALTDVDGDIVYTFNLDDFKTDDLFMNAN